MARLTTHTHFTSFIGDVSPVTGSAWTDTPSATDRPALGTAQTMANVGALVARYARC